MFDVKAAGLEIGGIKVDFKYRDTPEKEAKRVAAKLAIENDTLMVIGHLTSTATKDALPFYLNADPPIPVILADETNPQLLPPDYNTTYYPVFRLSPTDDEQAREAASFAVDHGAKIIWVVEDAVTNPVYSNYLAQEFVKQIHGLKSSKVLLWTTNRESPSADAVKALGINWVFFAGDWSNGLILTRQVKEIWKNQPIPSILLSNASANLELLREGGDDMKEVYLIHQMRASDFNSEGSAFWGTLASQLTINLIHGADNDFENLSKEKGGLSYTARQKIAGVHSVADARNALHWYMEKAVKTPTAFELGGQHLAVQRYTFKPDGKGREPKFHIWQVQSVGNELKFMDN